MPIVEERAWVGAIFGIAVKMDAGIRPAISENATAARYCNAEEQCGENSRNSAATIPTRALLMSRRGVAPRANSQPAARLPNALASTASAVNAPAAFGETPCSCRMVGRKPNIERN